LSWWLILNFWKEKSKFLGGDVTTVSLFRTVHRPTFCSLQILQYNAWILDLFNSAFRKHISKDRQMANSKLQRKYRGKQFTAYFEFPSQNFFVRTWKSYPTLRIACRSDGNSWIWNKSSESCYTTLSFKGFIFLTSHLNCVLH
jgi:hypothetical protein